MALQSRSTASLNVAWQVWEAFMVHYCIIVYPRYFFPAPGLEMPRLYQQQMLIRVRIHSLKARGSEPT